MTKIILSLSLMFSFAMSQQANTDNENTNVKEETEVTQTQGNSISQQYYKDQAVNAKCETSPQRGTYTEYHPNGMLKVFRIIH